MKKIGAVIGIIFLLMAGYVYKAPLTTHAENILYQSPCDTPKTYRIGSIDPKFNTTQDKFIYSINQAGGIWSSDWGKTLFKFNQEGDIEVNLIYDQRQFLSSQINDLNSKVKEQQQTLDPEINNYKKKAADFRVKAAQLSREIEFWNKEGGAPPEEYDKLKSRQSELQEEAESLQNEASRLNQSTEDYNSQVGILRQTVDSFNQTLTNEPEEGEYIYDNGKQTINIYFVESENEIVHTLAHELGHALGIGHNNNSLSIMYPRTTEAVALTEYDRAGLIKACEKVSVITPHAQKFALIVNQMRQKLSH